MKKKTKMQKYRIEKMNKICIQPISFMQSPRDHFNPFAEQIFFSITLCFSNTFSRQPQWGACRNSVLGIIISQLQIFQITSLKFMADMNVFYNIFFFSVFPGGRGCLYNCIIAPRVCLYFFVLFFLFGELLIWQRINYFQL